MPSMLQRVLLLLLTGVSLVGQYEQALCSFLPPVCQSGPGALDPAKEGRLPLGRLRPGCFRFRGHVHTFAGNDDDYPFR